MDKQGYVFQDVTALTAVAVGQAGNRTFYIAVGEGEFWVRVWLEKEELQSLSSAFAKLIETVEEAGLRPPLSKVDGLSDILFEPPNAPMADFKSSRIAIGYDQAHDRIGFFVYGPEAAEDSPSLTCWITRWQARLLGDKIDEVCAAGRPICVLCGGPVDPAGHVCPRSNGHRSAELREP